MTMGRIVRFSPGNGWFPAMVTAVHDDATVDLVVFGDQGGVPARLERSVPHESKQSGLKRRCWCWPPDFKRPARKERADAG